MRPEAKESPPAHAVEDLQVLAVRGLVELALVIADGAPVVDGRGARVAQAWSPRR
jgi:hypothetical protein